MARRNRLAKLVIDRVDLVDDGANPGASIRLFKRNEGDPMDNNLLDLGIDVSKIGKPISAANLARLTSARDALTALIEGASGDKMAEANDDKGKNKDGVNKGNEPNPATPNPAEDPVVKAQFADFQKKIDDLQKAVDDNKKLADEAVAKAAQEVEKRERADFAKQAEADLACLPGTAESKGGLLYTLSKKLSADDFKAIDTMLKAANEAAKTGQIVKELGADGKTVGDGSAFAKIKSLAADLVTKGTAKSEAEAIDMVATQNPALYERHLAELKAAK